MDIDKVIAEVEALIAHAEERGATCTTANADVIRGELLALDDVLDRLTQPRKVD